MSASHTNLVIWEINLEALLKKFRVNITSRSTNSLLAKEMPLKKRIAVFVGLWILAGVFSAVFSDITVGAGDSEFLFRLKLVYLAPLLAASGVAFTIVHGHYETWQQRDLYQQIVGWITIGIFTVHAIIALTRRSRQQFIGLTIIQFLFLVASTACVLFCFHYDATHGHG